MNDLCILYAPVITFAVSALKRIPFVKKNPKVIAAILAIAFNVLGVTVTQGAGSVNLTQSLIQCVLASFGGSVAFYEGVLDKNGVRSLARPV